MKGGRLLSLLVLLALDCFVMANNEMLLELKKSEGNDQSDHSASKMNQKLLELAAQEENTEEWRRKFKEMSKELAEKMTFQDTPEMDGKPCNDQSISKLQDSDAAAKDKLIAAVRTKLSTFSGPFSSRAKDSLSSFNIKWECLTDDSKKRVLDTLSVISSNIEAYGNAGEDPVSAIKGAIKILASISSNFGPQDQLLASMAQSFVSALLSLFGKGTEPKTLGEVVREHIHNALSQYRDEELSRKTIGLLSAFQQTKGYLNLAAMSGRPVRKENLPVVSKVVERSQGVAFMGKLASEILEMFNSNNNGRKDIKYCEMYALLAVFRDIILTQYISLIPSTVTFIHLSGMIIERELFRRLAGAVLGKLYTVDYDSKIIPYFDPDVSVITDTYSTEMLNMGKYDRSMAGLHCLMTEVGNVPKDMIWQQRFESYEVDGNPYIARRTHSNINCYWKLVPHGYNTYSIVNKRRCKEGNEYCGVLLSWSPDGNEAFVGISSDDPVLWEITGNNLKAIKNKRGCGKSQSAWCNYFLVLKNKPRNDNGYPLNLSVGQLVRAELSHSWEIRSASIVT